MTRVEQKTDDIKADVAEIKDTLKSLSENLVSQQEFRPVKALVYGFVVLLLVAMVGLIFINPLSSANQTVTITTQNPDGSVTTKTVPIAVAGSTPGTTVTQTNAPPSDQSSSGSIFKNITGLFK